MTTRLRLPEGLTVYLIAEDHDGSELRILPADVDEDMALTWNLSIGLGEQQIYRIKHGPLVAAESEVRTANVGSLGRAIAGNLYGTCLLVDRSASPIDEDMLEIDDRYDIDIHNGRLVANVVQRYPSRPPQSAQDISDWLAPIAAKYDCGIVDVGLELPGGTSPEELIATWPEGEEFSAMRAEVAESVAATAHDVVVRLDTDDCNTVETLMAGAAAVADLLRATKGGPLHAEGIINLLRAGHFNVLIGQDESDYLEAKSAPHPIWTSGSAGARAKIELAQDVARFANGDVGAVLVIGYRESGGDRNTIGALVPVADTAISATQIREVLDARIVPPVDGLLVEKFATSPTECVAAIYVPKQPSEMQPYLVHGAIVEDKLEGAFFSIVRRRGEGSITTSAQQIHAYIVAGKRYLRGDD